MARKTPKINVLLSINKTTFFKTSETNLEANYGTRKHDYWRDSSYFELKNSSLEGFSEKKEFFGLGTLRQAARQNFSPFKFTHFLPFKWFFQCVLFIGYQMWLERRSSRFSVFYFRSRTLQFGASVDVERENFSLQARGSTQPMIHTTVRS